MMILSDLHQLTLIGFSHHDKWNNNSCASFARDYQIPDASHAVRDYGGRWNSGKDQTHELSKHAIIRSTSGKTTNCHGHYIPPHSLLL